MPNEKIPSQPNASTQESDPVAKFYEFAETLSMDQRVFHNDDENPSIQVWQVHLEETDSLGHVLKFGNRWIVNEFNGQVTLIEGDNYHEFQNANVGFTAGQPYATISGEMAGSRITCHLHDTDKLEVFNLGPVEPQTPPSEPAPNDVRGPKTGYETNKERPGPITAHTLIEQSTRAENAEPHNKPPEGYLEKKRGAHEDYDPKKAMGATALSLEKVVFPGYKRGSLRVRLQGGISDKEVLPAAPVLSAFQTFKNQAKREHGDNEIRRAIKKGDRPGRDKGWLQPGGDTFLRRNDKAAKEIEKYVVPASPTSSLRRRRLPTGRVGGQVLAGGENISKVTFGPSGGGKTALLKGEAVEWQMSDSGFAVFYSTTAELDFIEVSEQFGPVYVFAPFGLGKKNKNIEEELASHFVKISPVDACKSWEGAKITAASLVGASQEGLKKTSNDDYFVTHAQKLFAVALWSAKQNDRPMSEVIRVVKKAAEPDGEGRQELTRWLVDAATKKDVDPYELQLANDDLEAFYNKGGRNKTSNQPGSITGQLEVILEPWSLPSVMRATERSTVMPEDLVNKPGMLIIVGTDSNKQHGQIYANLIERILDATRKEQVLDPETKRPVPPERGTALFIDEVQNAGVIPSLIQTATDGRKRGTVLSLGIQNGEKFAEVYSAASVGTLMNNCVIMALAGTDDVTAERIGKYAGTYEENVDEVKKEASKMAKLLASKPVKDEVEAVEKAANNFKTRDRATFTINHTKNLKDNQAIVMFQARALALVETTRDYENEYIIAAKNRAKNAMTYEELARKTGVGYHETDKLEEAALRYENGQSITAINLLMRMAGFREAAAIKLEEAQANRAEKAHRRALMREARGYARRRDKEADRDFVTVEKPVMDPQAPSVLIHPNKPPIVFEESLVVSRKDSPATHRLPRAERTQPAHAVGQYLGIEQTVTGPRTDYQFEGANIHEPDL